MKSPRHSSYPMPIEDKDALAAELSEFGYRETDDPIEVDRRGFYKVERWDKDELHVVEMEHASNDLGRARNQYLRARRSAGRAVATFSVKAPECCSAGRAGISI